LTVFVFNDSENVKFFDDAMKKALKAKYSVGNSKTGLEHYQCKDSNTGDIVVKMANNMFEILDFEKNHFCHIMEFSLVDDYNKASQHNISSTLSVPASFEDD